MLVVGLEPTCCLQHRILSPTGCPQPSKQPLLANATSVFCEYSTQTTRTLPLPSHKNKKASSKTRGTLVLVVGLEPTCCLQHRILSPTGCLQPSKQPLLANALASMPSPDLGETRARPLRVFHPIYPNTTASEPQKQKSLEQNPRHIGAGGGT